MTIESTTVIDEITYTTKTLSASAGLVILPKLLALCGESVLKIFFAAGDEETRAALLAEPRVVAQILHGMATNAAETDGLLVVQDLFINTTADKVRIGETEVEGSIATHFDTHFAGRYAHLAAVAMWVAQTNFIAP